MRLQSSNTSDEAKELQNFVDWIISIGEGNNDQNNNGESLLHIPNKC